MGLCQDGVLNEVVGQLIDTDIRSEMYGSSTSALMRIAFDAPDSVEDDIDIDDYYEGVIFDGLVKYIQDMGFWGLDDEKGEFMARYELSLRRAHTFYNNTQTIYTRTSGA